MRWLLRRWRLARQVRHLTPEQRRLVLEALDRMKDQEMGLAVASYDLMKAGHKIPAEEVKR